ncbi:MAG: hypothetical protein AAF646_01920 [Pseudomonadota bacterium]
MSVLEVRGCDIRRGAYRVRLVKAGQDIDGIVPTCLIGESNAPGAPRHQHANEWLANNKSRIEAALCAKREGRAIRAPFDRVTLAEEK